MTQGVVMSRYIQKGGHDWNPRGWQITFDSRAIVDQVVIRNDHIMNEKISITFEEAESFSDFIQEAKKAYAKWKRYQRHSVRAFAEDYADEREMSVWYLIDTAPKDDWILVTEETGSRIDQVRWVPEADKKGYNWVTLDGAFQPNAALKYWMPIPKAPSLPK